MPIGKRKRVSKKKKGLWRKHSNIDDVEDFLEEERLQKRSGGLVREKTDDELFFIQTTDFEKPSQSQKTDSISAKSKTGINKKLRCHQNLVGLEDELPATKKVVSKKPTVQSNITIKDILPKERIKHDKLALLKKLPSRPSKIPTADRDLWAGSKPDADKNIHYLRVTKKLPIKTPPNFHEKPSQTANVEVPLPGQSYNPEFKDHQDLLRSALNVEKSKKLVEKKLKRALDDKFPNEKISDAERLREMSEGLFNVPQKQSTETVENELDQSPELTRKQAKRKTKQQRRRETLRALKEEVKNKDKSKRINENQVYRIKSIVKELAEKDHKMHANKLKNKLNRDRKSRLPQKLGKLRFEEPEIQLKLSHELRRSLRELVPEGHLLNDRFTSLQKRNHIETRVRTKLQPKYKRKYVIKRSHREAEQSNNKGSTKHVK